MRDIDLMELAWADPAVDGQCSFDAKADKTDLTESLVT
jgi:hypothetical protein